MKNVIQFRRGFINLETSSENSNYQMAMSIVSELMQFGYILDLHAIRMLENSSIEDLTKFHSEVISYLKKATGSTRNFRPFWKGFPQEVMEKSECELWFHQIVHYISNGNYEPSDWTKQRGNRFRAFKIY